MALSDKQLMLLDCLIYLDSFQEGDVSVAQLVQQALRNGNSGGAGMSADEWNGLLSAIQQDSTLMRYQITNYAQDNSGARMACFVDNTDNPKDVNVVFRGTTTDAEWDDNFRGAYLADTPEQKKAAQYVTSSVQQTKLILLF